MAKTRAVAATQTGTKVMIPTTTQQVPKVIEQLKAQLSQLKGNTEEQVSLDVYYNGKNIKTVDTVKELLEISASLHAREVAYKAEVVRYGLENANIQPFSQEGKSLVEWQKIIAKAINELINSKQIQKIENAIKELSKHLDEETKLKNTLAEVMQNATEFVK